MYVRTPLPPTPVLLTHHVYPSCTFSTTPQNNTSSYVFLFLFIFYFFQFIYLYIIFFVLFFVLFCLFVLKRMYGWLGWLVWFGLLSWMLNYKSKCIPLVVLVLVLLQLRCTCCVITISDNNDICLFLHSNIYI